MFLTVPAHFVTTPYPSRSLRPPTKAPSLPPAPTAGRAGGSVNYAARFLASSRSAGNTSAENWSRNRF